MIVVKLIYTKPIISVGDPEFIAYLKAIQNLPLGKAGRICGS